MSGYLLGIIGTVLLAALVTGIAPKGKTADAVKGTAKVVCLIAIVSPVLHFFVQEGNLEVFFENSVIETDALFIEYCREKRIESAQAALEKTLEEEFGGAFEVTLVWSSYETQEGFYEAEQIKIEKVCVQAETPLEEEMLFKIEKYIETGYACEAEVRNAE